MRKCANEQCAATVTRSNKKFCSPACRLIGFRRRRRRAALTFGAGKLGEFARARRNFRSARSRALRANIFREMNRPTPDLTAEERGVLRRWIYYGLVGEKK